MISADFFQQKLYRPEGIGTIYLKWWKGRTYNQEYFTQQDSVQADEEIKSFPDKQKLWIANFEVMNSTTKSALQQTLKEPL